MMRLTIGRALDGRLIAAITEGGHPQIDPEKTTIVLDVSVVQSVAEGKRWFTIQRVRGNPGGGAVSELKRSERLGNGDVNESAMDEEGDSTMLDPGLTLDLDHKHTLEESDRIKKNTVQRWLAKEEKERKRLSVSAPFYVCFSPLCIARASFVAVCRVQAKDQIVIDVQETRAILLCFLSVTETNTSVCAVENHFCHSAHY